MYPLIILVILQFLHYSSTKLILDEVGWNELTLERVTEEADLIDSVTEEAENCKWIKVIRNIYQVKVVNSAQHSKINLKLLT